MQMFVMLTRLSPDALSSPGSLKKLERKAVDQVGKKCPKVNWVKNFAVLGGCDYLDIFQAPDIEAAMQVSTIVRSFGHATTEIWPVTEWSRFKELNWRPGGGLKRIEKSPVFLGGKPGLIFCLVPKERLELSRPIGHHPLKMACLPVPPLRHVTDGIYTVLCRCCQP